MTAPAPSERQLDWAAQIERAEDEAREAFLARDIDRLTLLWSEDLTVNSPIGRVLNRDEVFDLLQRGVIAHASFALHIESMHRHHDTVVVMGHDVVTDRPGSPATHRRYTNVWVANGASWRMVARHANVAHPEAGR